MNILSELQVEMAGCKWYLFSFLIKFGYYGEEAVKTNEAKRFVDLFVTDVILTVISQTAFWAFWFPFPPASSLSLHLSKLDPHLLVIDDSLIQDHERRIWGIDIEKKRSFFSDQQEKLSITETVTGWSSLKVPKSERRINFHHIRDAISNLKKKCNSPAT
ncbi:hypothetical protein L6164_019061 [Bauhinia variegata]|uniref:Uncharacterized protein n=1 Tax=Bauhinia variegata TaxID=167791 RepID=A0ACB9ND48_BAUVA|nr:hypothetical protein L6164_019061 [Bauhinia variegata]